jgi:twinkle protein
LKIDTDGGGFCFSCQEYFTPKEIAAGEIKKAPPKAPAPPHKNKKLSPEEVLEFPMRGFKDRAITKEVCEFFGVRVSYDSAGNIEKHYYPYRNNEAFKERICETKEFFWVGKVGGLFGQDKFSGGGKRLVITEGEVDALSVAQASLDNYGKIYPVVSIPSATMLKYLLEAREWVRSFKEVVLCFDEDEAGRKAVKEAVKIVGYDKAKVTKLPFKDANVVLTTSGYKSLMFSIYDATPYVPSGIMTKDALWAALENYNNIPSVPFPPCLDGVNTKVKGMRGGEITLFVSGTGSGKSTVLREICEHIISTTDEKIGIISLEESPAETARKLAGMAINRNPANEEIPIEDLKVGFDRMFGDDRIIVLDHQGSINDGSIIDQLEYMALAGCTKLLVDHITILVSEGAGDLRGLEAQDKVMNDLLRLVKRHPQTWLGLVSHLRKTPSGGKSFEEGALPTLDDIRGSGSIKQISFDIIAFARNMSHKDERKRNQIRMAVLKSRYTGLTGPCDGAEYNQETGRLSWWPMPKDDDDDFSDEGDTEKVYTQLD